MRELKRDYTIVIVTHNMQQAARVSDRTAFFTVEVDEERAAAPACWSSTTDTDEDLHEPERPAHRGLHHRPLRVG